MGRTPRLCLFVAALAASPASAQHQDLAGRDGTLESRPLEVGPGADPLGQAATADDIDACVRENFPDDSMVQTVNLVMTDRVGAERTLEAERFWQKDPATQLSRGSRV